MEKSEKEVKLKPYIMDNLILGTGLIESIISGSLSTYGKLSLNVECENQYSGAMRTLTIRELQRFFAEESLSAGSQYQERKMYGFGHQFFDGISGFEDFTSQHGFRNFNIDFLPRLIFSSSKATDYMVQAQIDNYISFRVIKSIYTLDAGSLSSIPTHKGEIFKSTGLSLLEKKELFNFLSVAMRYFSREIEDQEDEQNSINDFKKQIYSEHAKVVDKLSGDSDLKQEHFTEFMKRSGVTSNKLTKMVGCCLCNFRINPDVYQKIMLGQTTSNPEGSNTHSDQFEDQSSKEMLRRLSIFVESLNVQSTLPYLYPIYGCGDITQIFSRISSVYGSVFILDKEFEFLDYKVEAPPAQETEETDSETRIDQEKPSTLGEQMCHKFKFKVRGEENVVYARNLVIGGEYHKFAQKVLEIPEKNRDNDSSNLVMHRVSNIVKIQSLAQMAQDEVDGTFTSAFEQSLPILIQIPDSQPDLDNIHPITVLITDYTCQSCPQNYCVIYTDYLIDSADSDQSQLEKQAAKIYDYVTSNLANLLNFGGDQLFLNLLLRVSHLQKYQNSRLIELGDTQKLEAQGSRITILPDDDIGLDMERAFQQAKNYISSRITLEQDLIFKRQQEQHFDRKDDSEVEENDDYAEEKQLLNDLEDFDIQL